MLKLSQQVLILSLWNSSLPIQLNYFISCYQKVSFSQSQQILSPAANQVFSWMRRPFWKSKHVCKSSLGFRGEFSTAICSACFWYLTLLSGSGLQGFFPEDRYISPWTRFHRVVYVFYTISINVSLINGLSMWFCIEVHYLIYEMLQNIQKIWNLWPNRFR